MLSNFEIKVFYKVIINAGKRKLNKTYNNVNFPI